jgi:hypothetical protein
MIRPSGQAAACPTCALAQVDLRLRGLLEWIGLPDDRPQLAAGRPGEEVAERLAEAPGALEAVEQVEADNRA